MLLSFTTFVLLAATLASAVPLDVDPKHLQELQANPNYEHHRPTFADFVQRSVSALTDAAQTYTLPLGALSDANTVSPPPAQ